MTTPAPSPDFPTPPTPPAAAPSGPLCVSCGDEAVVHWQRRPTEGELTELVAAEQDRRDNLIRLADPQLPTPQFGPLPTGDGMTRTVYACAAHAIDLEPAALIHQPSCTAPNAKHLPGCDCTPETLPDAPLETEAERTPSRLPANWVTGSA